MKNYRQYKLDAQASEYRQKPTRLRFELVWLFPPLA